MNKNKRLQEVANMLFHMHQNNLFDSVTVTRNQEDSNKFTAVTTYRGMFEAGIEMDFTDKENPVITSIPSPGALGTPEKNATASLTSAFFDQIAATKIFGIVYSGGVHTDTVCMNNVNEEYILSGYDWKARYCTIKILAAEKKLNIFPGIGFDRRKSLDTVKARLAMIGYNFETVQVL